MFETRLPGLPSRQTCVENIRRIVCSWKRLERNIELRVRKKEKYLLRKQNIEKRAVREMIETESYKNVIE